ncbi:MAG: hypothetical protein JWM30_2862 [Burkholderia sp.]|jgi:GntR family transcriptional regulator of vanillate catabolism|nr:hypothetical protein [Burkholderia sp.]
MGRGKNSNAGEIAGNGADQAGASVQVTLSQTVTDRLRAAILEGQFLPNEKLQEVALAKFLDASRTPIRAALHSLASEGLVDYVPNRGYSVRGMDAERMVSVFDVRGVLEGLAARLAAENGMDEVMLTDYRDALAQGDRIVEKGCLVAEDRDLFGEINVRLHGAILRSADNRMLNDMLRQCQNIPISSERNVLWTDFKYLRRSHDDHHRLLEAIIMRDGARAEQIMREHVLGVKLLMKKELERMART